MHQWANIQLTLNYKKGLAVKVFNTNGEMQQFVTISHFLDEQRPQNSLIFFKNFNGYAKTVKLWEQHYDIPIIGSPTGNIRVDIDLSQRQFGASGWQPSKDRPGLYRLRGIEGIGFLFYTVHAPTPEKVNFTNPSTLGQLNANETLWNGVSCNSPNNFMMKFLNNTQITQQLQIGISNQFTVEFWIKIQKYGQNTTTDLFRLSTLDEDSLSVYIQNSTLICAPFGKNRKPKLIYQGVNMAETRWQHVSCGFQQQKKLWGQYLAYTRKKDSLLLPFQFSQSLAQSTLTTPNYVQPIRFTVAVGGQGLVSLFKDVKLWTINPDPAQLYTYRFKQVQSDFKGLVLNYKLMNGDKQIFNSVDRSQATIVGKYEMRVGDGSNIVCAVDHFFNATGGNCASFPFDTLPITYLGDETEQNGILMTMTNRFRQSSYLLPSTYSPFTTTWLAQSMLIQNTLIVQQKFNTDLLLPASSIGDGYSTVISAIMTDSKNDKQQIVTQQFFTKRCFYLANPKTDKSVSKVVFLKDGKSSQCFSIQVMKESGCSENHFNALSSQIDIQTSPFIPDILAKASITADISRRYFDVCFQANSINKMISNQPVNFVFNVFSTTSKDSTNMQSSYINAVYQVIMIDEIKPDLTVSNTTIDIDQSVLFDASKSLNTATNSSQGLVYTWVCPKIFIQYCDTFKYLSVLEITPDAFKQYSGVPETNYDFKVQVWSLSTGLVTFDPLQIFSKTVTVKWGKLDAPQFKVIIPPVAGVLAATNLLSSRDCMAQIQMSNYRITDKNLEYSWVFTPPANQANITMSISQSAILIKAGALSASTSYKLSVTIKNKESGFSGTEQISFTTGAPPAGGTLVVSPNSGLMLSTLFQISLQGWQSSQANDKSLFATIYGVSQYSPLNRLQMGRSNLNFTNSLQLSLLLPQIVGVQVEIMDSSGEQFLADQKIQVDRNSGNQNYTDWRQMITTVSKQNQLQPVAKYQYFGFIAKEMNEDVLSGIYNVSEAQTCNEVMLQQASDDIWKIYPTDSYQNTTGMMMAINTMVTQATALNWTLNADSSSLALKYVTTATTKIAAFAECSLDSHFLEKYTTIIGNLLSYATNAIKGYETALALSLQVPNKKEKVVTQPQDDPRLKLDLPTLQDMVHALIVQKNALLDQLCANIPQGDIQVKISTPPISLLVQRIQTNQISQDVTFMRARDASAAIIPTDQIVKQTLNFNPQINSVCLQASFWDSNPTAGYALVNQTVYNNSMFFQISTLDSLGNRLAETQGFKNLDLTPLKVFFSFNFYSDFYNNQTMCMTFNGNVADSNSWDGSECTTEYLPDSIICRCTAINNHYIGIVRDQSRIQIVPQKSNTQLNMPFIFIVIPLVLLGLVGLPLAVFFDVIGRNLVFELNVKMGLNPPDEIEKELQYIWVQRNYRYIDTLQYNFAELQRYKRLHERKGGKSSKLTCSDRYTILRRNMHPILSIVQMYDFSIARLIRMFIMLMQISLVTIIVFALFCEQVTVYFDDNLPKNVFEIRWVMFSFLLAFLLLPLPNFILNVFRSVIVERQSELSSRNSYDEKGTKEQTYTEGDNTEVETRCNCVKIVITACSLALFVFAVLESLGLMMTISSISLWEYSTEEASLIVACWWLTMAFGYFVFPELRILTMVFLAPGRVHQRQEWETENQNKQSQSELSQPDQAASKQGCCCRMLVPEAAVEILLDCYAVFEFLDGDQVEQGKEMSQLEAFKKKHENEVEKVKQVVIPSQRKQVDKDSSYIMAAQQDQSTFKTEIEMQSVIKPLRVTADKPKAEKVLSLNSPDSHYYMESLDDIEDPQRLSSQVQLHESTNVKPDISKYQSKSTSGVLKANLPDTGNSSQGSETQLQFKEQLEEGPSEIDISKKKKKDKKAKKEKKEKKDKKNKKAKKDK